MRVNGGDDNSHDGWKEIDSYFGCGFLNGQAQRLLLLLESATSEKINKTVNSICANHFKPAARARHYPKYKNSFLRVDVFPLSKCQQLPFGVLCYWSAIQTRFDRQINGLVCSRGKKKIDENVRKIFTQKREQIIRQRRYSQAYCPEINLYHIKKNGLAMAKISRKKGFERMAPSSKLLGGWAPAIGTAVVLSV